MKFQSFGCHVKSDDGMYDAIPYSLDTPRHGMLFCSTLTMQDKTWGESVVLCFSQCLPCCTTKTMPGGFDLFCSSTEHNELVGREAASGMDEKGRGLTHPAH